MKWVMLAMAYLAAPGWGAARREPEAVLPEGVRAVWDLGKAYRAATPTRERVSINGLWRWQPGEAADDAVPAGGWGYFKVPGSWPGITDYMQKDSQVVHPHPDWRGKRLSGLNAGWYQREISVPKEWMGRRVSLRVESLNSYAAVYVDGAKAGEARFPGGEVDLTAAVKPGNRHALSLHVVAMPLQEVMESYGDSASVKTVQGTVNRRGLCGDAWLESAPAGPRIEGVTVRTSVRRGEITIGAAIAGAAAESRYAIRARIVKGRRTVKEFTSPEFSAAGLEEGRFSFTRKWNPRDLWDVHTPGNVYGLELALRDTDGKVLDDAHPARFGFRELWIEGRDLILNGTRIFLSVQPLDNAQIGAALATYAAAQETMERLKEIGVNAVYTHNYGCEPGSHLGFEEILRAADDAGMLVFFSQPHFGQYRWDAAGADETNGYARDAAYYVRAAGNHPSVVMYAMSHNGAGYAEDMNPDLMEGNTPERDSWSKGNSVKCLRAEAIVRRLDPGRIVYHHSAGDLGSLFTINYYANFVPRQEQSDWFENWSARGVKPLFLCEYGVPLSWDWAMYRGWYKGEREFGSATVPWEFCQAEWSSQFLGDRAFRITEMEKANLRWEARKFAEGKLWYRWDYPYRLGSNVFDDRHEVIAGYLTDNLRAFRAWGLSGYCVWDHGQYWRLREGAGRGRKEFPTDWDDLQRPGFSPDFEEARYERFDIAFERRDWVPTVAAEALVRNGRPLLAYIAGKPGAITSKDHDFHPGETVEKQIIVVNGSREAVKAACAWTLGLAKPVRGRRTVKVKAGEQARIPLKFALPSGAAPGEYALEAKVEFGTGEVQEDSFAVHVLARPAPPRPAARIALYDPQGETARLLTGLGIGFDPVNADADFAGYDVAVVGKGALAVGGPAPALARVREGLKVVVFEQTGDVMEKRLGFRVAEYGLRNVFERVPGHPLLAGLVVENLRDWRGEATILPPRREYGLGPMRGPKIKWCGIEVPHVWRCGNRGNVASVLVEKPARGDFLPVLDGGYSLQYSPLMEYREGAGMVLFCQMDVTGRTENDPAADRLVRNIIGYAAGWRAAPRRRVTYLGNEQGKLGLESAGVTVEAYAGGDVPPDRLLAVAPGAGRELSTGGEGLKAWLDAGGKILAMGLDEKEAGALIPVGARTRKGEYISAFFEPAGADSPLAGVGPADVHNRAPRELELVAEGAEMSAGFVAVAGNVVFCQMLPWHLDHAKNYGLKRTYRRTAFLLARLLGNLGAEMKTPVLERFGTPPAVEEKRWLSGLYLDEPEEWDYPYRFFRW